MDKALFCSLPSRLPERDAWRHVTVQEKMLKQVIRTTDRGFRLNKILIALTFRDTSSLPVERRLLHLLWEHTSSYYHLISSYLISFHLSLNREGRLGTTDDFTTSFLHFSLFSTALWDLANSRPVNSLMLFPPLTLSALSSSPFHCALQNGFCQT